MKEFLFGAITAGLLGYILVRELEQAREDAYAEGIEEGKHQAIGLRVLGAIQGQADLTSDEEQ